MGIEVYHGKLILYGYGDFLTDYEGIRGYESFRGDLSLMYFANLDISTGNLIGLRAVPTAMRKFRVARAADPDMLWIKETLNREGAKFGTSAAWDAEDGSLKLTWEINQSFCRQLLNLDDRS